MSCIVFPIKFFFIKSLNSKKKKNKNLKKISRTVAPIPSKKHQNWPVSPHLPVSDFASTIPSIVKSRQWKWFEASFLPGLNWKSGLDRIPRSHLFPLQFWCLQSMVLQCRQQTSVAWNFDEPQPICGTFSLRLCNNPSSRLLFLQKRMVIFFLSFLFSFLRKLGEI